MEHAGKPADLYVRALLYGDAGEAGAPRRDAAANQHYIRITIPNGVSYETFQPAAHPGWDGKDPGICKAFGEAWYEEQRTALLLVPSIPARLERNILINPRHPDAAGITHDLPEPVWWDERLYR